jgi:hypothetical protein
MLRLLRVRRFLRLAMRALARRGFTPLAHELGALFG